MTTKSRTLEAPDGPAWDSLRWQDLIGFDDWSAKLRPTIQQGSCPQTLLIEGRQGLGKRLFAAKLAAYSWCQTGDACGHCDDCRQIINGSHPEILWLESDSSFKVADADDAIEHLSAHAGIGAQGRRRLCCIIDFDRCTAQAANRLLKTLEEPASGSGFILTATRPEKLMPTILSRVVRLQARPAPPHLALATIKQLWQRNHSDHLPADATITSALRLSGGAIGGALSYLEAGDSVTADFAAVAAMLDSSDPSRVLALIEANVRNKRLGGNELAQRLEVVLNQLYRHHLQLGQDIPDIKLPAVDGATLYERCAHRRQLLRQVKALVLDAQVPLNAQLVAESWALGQLEPGLSHW